MVTASSAHTSGPLTGSIPAPTRPNTAGHIPTLGQLRSRPRADPGQGRTRRWRGEGTLRWLPDPGTSGSRPRTLGTHHSAVSRRSAEGRRDAENGGKAEEALARGGAGTPAAPTARNARHALSLARPPRREGPRATAPPSTAPARKRLFLPAVLPRRPPVADGTLRGDWAGPACSPVTSRRRAMGRSSPQPRGRGLWAEVSPLRVSEPVPLPTRSAGVELGPRVGGRG